MLFRILDDVILTSLRSIVPVAAQERRQTTLVYGSHRSVIGITEVQIEMVSQVGVVVQNDHGSAGMAILSMVGL